MCHSEGSWRAQELGDRMKTPGERQTDIMTFSAGPILQPTASKALTSSLDAIPL